MRTGLDSTLVLPSVRPVKMPLSRRARRRAFGGGVSRIALIAAGLALAGLPTASVAQSLGGNGGKGTAGTAGTGGGAGMPGGPGTGNSGGGGGAVGEPGGAGGGANGGAGGMTGVNAGAGGPGGAGAGGGGGAGGADPAGVATFANTANVNGMAGGSGGYGGAAAGGLSGGGGGGGAGGAGLDIVGAGNVGGSSVTVTGGAGGIGAAGGSSEGAYGSRGANGNGVTGTGGVGGAGGVAGSGGSGGVAGAAVIFSRPVTGFQNTGSLKGGLGGYGGNGGSAYGGTGAPGSIGSGNTGTGGVGGAGGVAGTGGSGSAGGAAAIFSQSVTGFQNSGSLTGGTGGYGGTGGSANGGTGGIGSNGVNSRGTGGTGGLGEIAGNGGAGGAGGVGATFAAPASLTNYMTITGGTGGNGGQGGSADGGQGGLGSNGFSNTGTGGNGGSGGLGGNGGNGGAGGAGLTFASPGSVLVNSGMISGGTGGAAGAAGAANGGGGGAAISGTGGGTSGTQGAAGIAGMAGTAGAGGIGIIANGITIDNTGGTIAGGMSGDGTTQAYAIQFTGGTNFVGTGGTITGGIDVLAGSFQPALNGTTPGTSLSVTGPVAFAPGSFYNIRITPTATDSVTATGAATLTGATVNVLAGQGTYAARQYTILTAMGGLGGTTFAGVTSNLAFLTPTLTYDTDDVFLNISGNAATPANPNAINYTTAAATTNQRAVAYGLNAGETATGGNNAILGAFNQLTVSQAQAAFNAISGEGFAAAQNTAFGSTGLFISSIFDQTTFYGNAGSSPNQITLTAPVPGFSAYAPSDGSFTRTPIHELADLPSRVAPIPAPVFVPQRTWRAWATGFGGIEDFSGNAFPVGSAGQSDTIYGGTLGVDYQLMPNYLAGLAIGGSNGDFSVPGRATSGSTTGGHVAFYDLATFGAFYAASTTSASFYSNQTTRMVAGFGGLAGETERGNFRSDAYSSKVEFGRHFSAYGGLITPFASIELTELRSYGFTETPLAGAGLFALNVQGQDTASVPSLVGARFQTLLPLGNGLVFSPSLQLAWQHQFSPQRPVLAGLINLPGAVFLTNGASPARDSAAVKAGGELAISRQAALFANFDGDFSGVDRFYGGKGGFKYVW